MGAIKSGDIIYSLIVLAHFVIVLCNPAVENQAKQKLNEVNKNYDKLCNVYSEAAWAFNTDLKNKTAKDYFNKIAVEFATFKGETAKQLKKFDYNSFTDKDLYRQFRFLKDEGSGGLDNVTLKEFQEIKSDMKSIYSQGTICAYKDPNPTNCTRIPLDPDLTKIMAESRDADELKYVWEQWRIETGQKIGKLYPRFVEISNAAAKIDGYANTGDSWLAGYTVDTKEVSAFDPDGSLGIKAITQADFRGSVERVWNQVSASLYRKLHAYVRDKLHIVYGNIVKKNGPIPAHLLGNMWAQGWGNIVDLINPFPEEPIFDVSESMKTNKWTIKKMFEVSETFFKSLGLFPMTKTFWEKSIIDKSKWLKDLVCHASAWDMCHKSGQDFRIKMCTVVNMNDLITVHHEMGHTEYQMAYKNLPYTYRGSANSGFHEAIGDLIALSVATPSHMTSVLGLTPKEADPNATPTSSKYTSKQKRDINFLMAIALKKIVFLPFGYLMDRYRWGLFDGTIPKGQENQAWWKLRKDIQGVTSPSGPRGEEFFDPGAKFHIPSNTPYVRYFVSFILQFQFHKQLCSIAGHTGSLHECDIYQNKAAGKVLKDALEKGFSTPWPLVLKSLGGSLEMNAAAIEEYFQPLITFLDEELKGKCVGWGSSFDDPNLCTN